MVHEYTPADNWWHDAVNEFCPISDGHPLVSPKAVGVGYVTSKTLSERIALIERCASNLKVRFKEALITDEYRKSSGSITHEEYENTVRWYESAVSSVDAITKNYYMTRGYKEMPTEEYTILYNHIIDLIHVTREIIRDRYIFEREIDRREEIKRVLGT